jgi:hypothetical protein
MGKFKYISWNEVYEKSNENSIIKTLPDYAQYVINELNKGEREFAIHPEPFNRLNSMDYIDIGVQIWNDTFEDIHGLKRKVCHEIGDIIEVQTVPIKATITNYVMNNVCFLDYTRSGINIGMSDYDRWVYFYAEPYTRKVGVKFYFKGEKEKNIQNKVKTEVEMLRNPIHRRKNNIRHLEVTEK